MAKWSIDPLELVEEAKASLADRIISFGEVINDGFSIYTRYDTGQLISGTFLSFDDGDSADRSVQGGFGLSRYEGGNPEQNADQARDFMLARNSQIIEGYRFGQPLAWTNNVEWAVDWMPEDKTVERTVADAVASL